MFINYIGDDFFIFFVVSVSELMLMVDGLNMLSVLLGGFIVFVVVVMLGGMDIYYIVN